MVRYPRSVSAEIARMISYGQNAEDVLIDRVFQKSSGFFIDVGAFHPVIDSVTKHFSLLGWHGINIEPDAEIFAELARDRPAEINLCCAVGRQSGEALLRRLSARQCSTISDERFDHLDADSRAGSIALKVPLRSLAEICADYVTSEIDFLKIDVEGSETDVVFGADWARFRPRLLIIEATLPGSSEPNWQEWEPFLLSQDYLFQHFDGINRFYLRREDQDLAPQLSVPVNYLDWYFSFRDMLAMQNLTGSEQALESLT